MAQTPNSQAEADGELHTYNVVAQVLFPLEARQKRKFSQSAFYEPAYFYFLAIWIHGV